MKRVIGIYSAPRQHWVGDGFPVRSLFSYQTHGRALSPFLLLDRAGPAHFEPADHARGVGEHPHRGFETVLGQGRSELFGFGDVLRADEDRLAGLGLVHSIVPRQLCPDFRGFQIP